MRIAAEQKNRAKTVVRMAGSYDQRKTAAAQFKSDRLNQPIRELSPTNKASRIKQQEGLETDDARVSRARDSLQENEGFDRGFSGVFLKIENNNG
jgi:hypothetical protein